MLDSNYANVQNVLFTVLIKIIQSSANKLVQTNFACIFNNITYKLKHLRFQLTQNENCKQRLDQASVCLDDF